MFAFPLYVPTFVRLLLISQGLVPRCTSRQGCDLGESSWFLLSDLHFGLFYLDGLLWVAAAVCAMCFPMGGEWGGLAPLFW